MPSPADLMELVRAPAALSVPGDVLAGAAAAGGPHRRSAGLAGASVLLYWAGMAANDWADRDLDARERPERPIPSGRVSPTAAMGSAVGLTAAGLVAAGLAGGRQALATAVPLAGAVWIYDLFAKHTAAGPLVMATCRALDVLLGAGAGELAPAVPAAAVVAAHTYTVTVLSRHEVAGAPAWLAAATLTATAAVTTAAVACCRSRRRRVPVVLACCYGLAYGAALARATVDPRAATVRSAVGAGITGLPLLQGALVAGSGAPALGTLVAAVAPLGRRLARKVSPT